MRICLVCGQEAEHRHKHGWTVMACTGWFSGACSGQPLAVTPPPTEQMQRLGNDVTDDQNYFEWINTKLRQLFPVSTAAD